MDDIRDPDNFQTSEIVQKSSKSGIFSNKRLLVVKNGFLYYFTKVPEKYKGHVPNILNTFKQLPKSSIQIRAIQNIKMQSSNSSNLIIIFSQKDMIQKQAIRKSIADENYRYTKKQTKDLQEWKFTFSSRLKCRLWYTGLLKLKSHFIKQQEKINQFLTNFKPANRNTQQAPSPVNQLNTPKKQLQKNQNSRSPSTSIIQQFKNQDAKKQQQQRKPQIPVLPSSTSTYPKPMVLPSTSPKPMTLPSQKLSQKPAKLPQIPVLPSTNDKKQLNDSPNSNNSGSPKLQTIKQQDEPLTLKQDQSMKYINNLSTPKNISKPPAQSPKDSKQSLKPIKLPNQQKSSKSSPIKLPISTETTPIHKKYDQQHRIRKQQQQKADRIIRQMKIQLQQRNRQVRTLQKALTTKQKQIQMIQKQRQLDSSLIIKQSQIYEPRHTLRTIQLNQFSVQTDEQDDYNPNNINNSFQQYRKNRTYDSFLQDFASTQRDTYNIYRNTESLAFQLKEQDKTYDNYDFYQQLGKLYTTNPNIKTRQILEQSTSQKSVFEEQIKRQIKLINYVQKMRSIAEQTIRQYIDQSIQSNNQDILKKNRTFSFQSTLFYIKIACSSGKIVNIGGQEKLVYSNKQHQQLKRQFKIYDTLQNRILKLLRKKSNYPVRVPLSYLFQYRGFTSLMMYLPYTKPLNASNQALKKLYRLTQKIVVDKSKIEHFDFTNIANRKSTLYLMTNSLPYKINKISQQEQINPINSKLKNQNTFSMFQAVQELRKLTASSNNHQLTKVVQNMRQQLDQLKNKKKYGKLIYIDKQRQKSLEQKIMSIQQFMFCRNLKNLYRSTEPFSNNAQQKTGSPKTSTFLQGFLSSPKQISELVSSDQFQSGQVLVNGLFLSYCEQLYGFKIPTNINIVQFFKEYHTSLAEKKPIYDENHIQQEKQYEQTQQYLQDQLSAITIYIQPVCRSLSLSETSANRLLQNIEVYIQTQKYNLVDSAIEIMHQIDHRKPELDKALHLLIIKYKMKTAALTNDSNTQKSKSQITYEKLQRCKKQLESILAILSPHSVLRFKCQCLLIQALSSLKMYPETITLIFDTITNLHFMFGEPYAGGEMDDCLYLLAAEILAKMGKTKQSLTIYKKLLSNEQTAIANQQIFLSLAGVSDSLMNSGPQEVIQLLLPLISNNNETISQGSIKKSTQGCFISKYHSRIYNLVAHQYILVKKIQQSTKYFEYSLAYFTNLLEDKKNENNQEMTISKINIIPLSIKQQSDADIGIFTDNCIHLFKFYNKWQNEKMQKQIMLIFGTFIEWAADNIYHVGGICWRRQKSFFLTNATQIMVDQLLHNHPQQSNIYKQNILQILQQMRQTSSNKQKNRIDIQFLVKYQDLAKLIKKMSLKETEITQKQIEALNQLNLTQLQTYILSL